MNYLAHLFLSQKSSQYLVGSLLGDFIKKTEIYQFNNDIRFGMELHQKIDIYTDSHALVQLSKRLIKTERRRFSGILIDVFFDHFLAINWKLYSKIDLRNFADFVYSILLKNKETLPEDINSQFKKMIDLDILYSYQEIDGVYSALERISSRITRKNNLKDGIQDLNQNYQQIQENFLVFFPDLISFVHAQ
jgi:acyl carrier protein phosphodiesterase